MIVFSTCDTNVNLKLVTSQNYYLHPLTAIPQISITLINTVVLLRTKHNFLEILLIRGLLSEKYLNLR